MSKAFVPKMVKVREYLDYFRQKEYLALFGEDDLQKLQNVEKVYGDVETKETILETCLSQEKRSCDYSVRVDVESPYLKEYWYELDSDACSSEDIAACYFVDAAKVIPGEDNGEYYEKVLVPLAGEERVDKLRDMLELCVAKLEGRNKKLFQFGAMTGRGQYDSIRLFSEDLKREDVISYLQDLNWRGDLEALNRFLEKWEPYSDHEKFILDFDIYADGISEKIGICFGTKKKDTQTIKAFLEALCLEGLCLESKKEDVLRFVERFPSHTPFIQNDISHFKFPFIGDKVTMAKVYLRQGSERRHLYYKAYDTPVLMNLELTTRCPLRCPQCYCDLMGGKDLSFEHALYWIEEAAKNNVRVVNLSGGETMVYPHLMEVIRACHERGMLPNVALSGYGVEKEVLRQMIDAGVHSICVSLNGSTEEVNRHSRDGYHLAVKTLELLDEIGYEKTCINWVMHSTNADDFENMVALAETYHVAEIAVMVFKPDALHQLPSVPSREQMKRVAQFIKRYQGPIHLEAEECFSQMRAMVGKRFFGNLNRGVERGCGAGRDGISISVDGKLTPCRHLEFEEGYTSIREYWENSELLKTLRRADDEVEEPCAACEYSKFCLPCMAVNWKMKGRLYMGDTTCPIQPERSSE